MKLAGQNINEQFTATAFSKQSVVFDELYSRNTIVNYKRERVRATFMQYVLPGSTVLELNCGTGEDAIFFAGQDYKIHATDVSEGMIAVLKEKVRVRGLTDKITNECCSYTALNTLKNKQQYDAIFSNFGGLNCTDALDKVLLFFNDLLKPGGIVCLVVIPKFCLWETLLFLKGKFKTAFRRFFSKNGRRAHIEGKYFTCWYYNPSYITGVLKNNFTIETIEGLCTIVPPSYIEGFAEKYPRVFKFLAAKENKLKAKRPWRSIGDYSVVVVRKKE